MCDCSCKTHSLGAAWSKGYLQWLVLLFPSAQESLCKALDCWVSGTSTFFSKAAKSVEFATPGGLLMSPSTSVSG